MLAPSICLGHCDCVCRLPASGWHGGFSAYSGLRGSPTQPKYLESHRLSAAAGPSAMLTSLISGVCLHICACMHVLLSVGTSACLSGNVPTCVCVCALLESTLARLEVASLSTQGQSVSLLRASPSAFSRRVLGSRGALLPSPGCSKALWSPSPSNQAAEPVPLTGPLGRGDQEPGCREQLSCGPRAVSPAWAVDMVICPRAAGLAPVPPLFILYYNL